MREWAASASRCGSLLTSRAFTCSKIHDVQHTLALRQRAFRTLRTEGGVLGGVGGKESCRVLELLSRKHCVIGVDVWC